MGASGRLLGMSGIFGKGLAAGLSAIEKNELPTFYPEITMNLVLEKCEFFFFEKCDFQNVNFV